MPEATPGWPAPLLVFLGGGLGAVLRYLLSAWLSGYEWGRSFPWATLLINVLGSFVLGLIAALLADRPGWKLFFGVGVCGGFTTFSTFSLDAWKLLESARYGAAAGYVLGSVVGGLLGAWVGLKMFPKNGG